MIIPLPTSMTRLPGEFVLEGWTTVRCDGAEPAVDLLRGYLREATGAALPASPDGDVLLALDPMMTEAGDEGYTLLITPGRVVLRAPKLAGLLHGVQSIRQLLNTEGTPYLPCVDIADRPRFAWRGAMLDVARHFMPIGFLHRFVDTLALHKLNVLHLHLTDDQGWRMPVSLYPALTEVGSTRAETLVGSSKSTVYDGIPHGGSYTRAELAGLVAYAAARGVTVMPEIEMPGHARSALAAYPHLGNFPERRLPVWTRWGISDAVLGVQNQTLQFCRDVLTEVMEVFPSPRIHIGGDECPVTEWETSPAALARIASEGLSGPGALRGWFLREISEFLLDSGRLPVCWADADSGSDLPRDTAVMIWQDPAHGVRPAELGHEVIMTPYRSTYFDYPQSAGPGEPLGQADAIVTLEDVYRHQSIPAAWGGRYSDRVLGTQAQLWTEYAPGPREVEYLAFPRLCALAENSWSSTSDWAGFLSRLERHERLLSSFEVAYRPLQPLGQ